MQGVLLLFFMFVVKCSTEPQCSRFHYDEKLLEKMIRTEILVENMKKQIDDIQLKVKESLAKINQDILRWNTEFETLEMDSATKLSKINEKASKELDKNLQIIEDIKGKVMSPDVAFNAKAIKDTSPEPDSTVVFKETIRNLGEAYNSDTGVFTVPYGGTYLFTVQLCVDGIKYIDYGLVVDDVYINKARYRDNDSYVQCHSSTSSIYVKAGSKVQVKVIARSSGTLFYESNTNYWNTFSGVLIRADKVEVGPLIN